MQRTARSSLSRQSRLLPESTRTTFFTQGNIRYKISVEPVAFTNKRGGSSNPVTPAPDFKSRSIDVADPAALDLGNDIHQLKITLFFKNKN